MLADCNARMWMTLAVDVQSAQVVPIENLHRADLTVLERAEQETEWMALAEDI